MVGLAQSNARVSHFMRNVEASAFLEQPKLIEAKAVTQDNRRLSEFLPRHRHPPAGRS